ncbi:MAG: BrnA antitoxin family protein [Candidatus Shapirobacteria bacterium]
MKNSKKIKPIPRFQNEDKERDFWATHDTTEYFDVDKTADLDLSELKPSTKSITIRLPESLLANLKVLAHQKDIPYQSLVKVYLAQQVKREYQQSLMAG